MARFEAWRIEIARKRLTLLEHGEDEEQRKIHRRWLAHDRGSRASTFVYPG